MSERKTKLELTWIGKENRPRLKSRILLEDPELSYSAQQRVGEGDIFDNMLIQGDNLLALKAIEQQHAGDVKCVYIDPPYNTGSAFEHYDDGIEHSIWLSLIRERLEVIRWLLADSGTIWISIDDNECHYLKVLCDEVFGRHNFVANVVWQKKYSPSNDALWLSESHEHLLVYARNKAGWRPNQLPRTSSADNAYKNPDNDSRGAWKAGDYTCNKSVEERPNLYYAVVHPVSGEEIWPKRTAVWRYSKERHLQNVADGLVWWGKGGKNKVPAFKRFHGDVDSGMVPQTLWTWEEVGHTQDGKKEQIAIHPSAPFSTPKPESLVHRIVQLASNPGDLVLDSFLGSGTTAAVAHKMGRRWIGIELGDHAVTHCVPRLKKVVDGKDPGGITDAVNWQGGGGFRFYRLAPSLLEVDKWGNWVINRAYNKEMLAEAMCKLQGFRYAPSPSIFWMHGQSSEQDYIYVTTQTLTHEQLEVIASEVGPDRTLLICCAAFRANHDQFPNLTITKIPAAVLVRCEWGKDDYSLNVQNVMPGGGRRQRARAAA